MPDTQGTLFHIGGTLNFRTKMEKVELDNMLVGDEKELARIVAHDDANTEVVILFRRGAAYGLVYKDAPLVSRPQQSAIVQ